MDLRESSLTGWLSPDCDCLAGLLVVNWLKSRDCSSPDWMAPGGRGGDTSLPPHLYSGLYSCTDHQTTVPRTSTAILTPSATLFIILMNSQWRLYNWEHANTPHHNTICSQHISSPPASRGWDFLLLLGDGWWMECFMNKLSRITIFNKARRQINSSFNFFHQLNGFIKNFLDNFFTFQLNSLIHYHSAIKHHHSSRLKILERSHIGSPLSL